MAPYHPILWRVRPLIPLHAMVPSLAAVSMACLLSLSAPIVSAETVAATDAPAATPPTDTSSSDGPAAPSQEPGTDAVSPATVQGLDGTKITLLVNGDGQAVTVATQNLALARAKRKKHNPLVGNPVDEPLSTGLINISTLTLVEDAQPELSNPNP